MTGYKYIFKFLLSLALVCVFSIDAFSQQVAAATGGEAISADNFTSGAYTPLTGPVITELAPGQISLGSIAFLAPTGFEWK